MEIPINEVMRYLGYHQVEKSDRASGEAYARISDLVKEASAVFAEKAAPKSVYGIWDCKCDSLSLTLGGISIKSKDLVRYMEGSSKAVLLAATLGTEADTLIRRFSVKDMEKAVVAEAVCTVIIEAYCDRIEEEIAQRAELRGLFSSGRFSPGYGDFDIAWQKDLLNMLNCDRKIGLTLSSGYMLVPSKSITALIGFGADKKQSREKCCDCARDKCDYREIG